MMSTAARVTVQEPVSSQVPISVIRSEIEELLKVDRMLGICANITERGDFIFISFSKTNGRSIESHQCAGIRHFMNCPFMVRVAPLFPWRLKIGEFEEEGKYHWEISPD